MKAVISFEIQWWNEEAPEILVRSEHNPALLETAYDQIAIQIADHASRNVYTATGLLHDNLRLDDRDPEDGVAYKGKWTAQVPTIQN